jgi:L-threonylcarbamoyladenylate synthase
MAKIGTDLFEANRILREGGLVAIPTETVYGLAADALNEEAVLNIFQAKGRPSFDPLICHFYSLKAASDYVQEIPDEVFALADAFMPGPLTLVLPKKGIPDIVTSGHSTVAVRIPNHPLSLELLEMFEGPLAAPSANPFGFVSPTSAAHVQDQLGEKIEYILDGGPCTVGLESTIIEYREGKPVVLRLGGLALEEIESVLGHPIDHIQTSSSNPNAPGMLSAHYSPGIPLKYGHLDRLITKHANKKLGIICLRKEDHEIPAGSFCIELSPNYDLNEAARKIFGALRQMRNSEAEIILAEEMPESFLGRAINDRLKRAAAQVHSD